VKHIFTKLLHWLILHAFWTFSVLLAAPNVNVVCIQFDKFFVSEYLFLRILLYEIGCSISREPCFGKIYKRFSLSRINDVIFFIFF
jgi:hypothetical protein